MITIHSSGGLETSEEEWRKRGGSESEEGGRESWKKDGVRKRERSAVVDPAGR